MRSLSRVLKADYVNVGSPKTIENKIIILENIKKTDKLSVDAQHLQKDAHVKADALINDAKQMYLRILDEANSEATQILDVAYVEIEKIKQTEMKNGYKEGYEKGYIDGKNETESLLQDASRIKDFLDHRKEVILKEIEENVIDLILDISKKVLGEELTQNKEAIFLLIQQALNKCAFKNKLIIRVSTLDFDNVNVNKDKLEAMVEGVSDIEVYEDKSLTQGSCVIETPSGEVNSSIDVQVKELEKIFQYTLRNE